MRCIVGLLVFFSLSPCAATGQVVPIADQIGSAVLAAPGASRADATVLGFNASGDMVTLRAGTNGLICLADDPEAPGFGVACYHEDMDPYMARGRELRAEGKERQEVAEIRTDEVEASTLPFPMRPTTLYVLTAEAGSYDPNAGTVKNPYLRFVIYVPYATGESTGLPTLPVEPGEPWLMAEGEHNAHIMISPPRE